MLGINILNLSITLLFYLIKESIKRLFMAINGVFLLFLRDLLALSLRWNSLQYEG